MREVARDRYGNEIYLTDERWDHIVDLHPEMQNYRTHLLVTLRRGRRKQDLLDSAKFKYYAPFDDLEHHYSHLVAVAKFGELEDSERRTQPNNFVLTAYQVFIYGHR